MRRLLDTDHLLLLALLLLHVAPLWFFPYFPSQDGPAHLENAVILREYRNDPFLQEFYKPNLSLNPNWFGHLVLALLTVVLPLFVAEKVLLTGYLLLLPVGVYYALNGVRPGAGWLTVLAFPFVQHVLYHMGFHNFCYSLAIFFFALGYWLRVQERFALRQMAVLAVLILLLYFCHLVPVAMAMMVVGSLGLLGTVVELRGGSTAKVGTVLLRRLVLPLAAFLPVLVLGLGFVGRQGTALAWTYTAEQLFLRLRHLEVLVSYCIPLPGPIYVEQPLVQAVFWGLMILTVGVLLARWRRRLWNQRDGFLALVGLAVVAYFTAPSSLSGGALVNTRLSLFPFFFLILWLGAHPFAMRTKRMLQLSATVLGLGLLSLHVLAYASFNDYLAEYLSAEPYLEADHTLLPLPFSQRLQTDDGRLADTKVSVFLHAGGYLAARRGVVELDNYEAATQYFPMKFRPDCNPFVHLATSPNISRGLEAEPPEIDIVAYETQTGKTIDYVLLWNVRPESRDLPAGKRTLAQLERGYELTYKSPRQLLHLYRRKSEP